MNPAHVLFTEQRIARDSFLQVALTATQMEVCRARHLVRHLYLYTSMKLKHQRINILFAKAILCFALLLPLIGIAQDTSKFVVKENFKREIVIGNKRYRVYNNWVTFGAGGTYHSENPRTQFALGMNYQFRINKYYFNLGGIMSGDEFGVWNNYGGHVGFVPFRRENEKRNMAAMVCVAYTLGYDFRYAGHYDPYRWDRLGLYAEFQYTMKLQYAVGIGPTFFIDINQKRSLIGVRLDGYLSGAYRGYVKGKAPVKPI